MVTTHFADAALPEIPGPAAPVVSPEIIHEMQVAGLRSDLGKAEVVRVQGQPFEAALRVTTIADPGTEWNLQVAADTHEDVHEGDVILACFSLRCIDSMSGDGCTGFVFSSRREPDEPVAELRVGTGRSWLRCFVPFRASRDYPAGTARVIFRVGFDRQVIEIGGIELINYGPDVDPARLPRTRISYDGCEPEAAWRKAALEQIEEFRKADLTVEVHSPDGRPVPDAAVQVELRRHAFGFGSCVTADQIGGTSEDDAKCRQFIERYCNRVVFENDMKWPAMWERVPDKLQKAVDWLLERRIEIRGHNLQWPSWNWSPRPLRQFEHDPNALRRLCAERITNAVSAFRGKLIHWDVVNEPYNNVDLLNLLGKEVIIDWLKLARAADPACRLYVNDFGIFDGGPGSEHRAHFFDTIRWLRESGAPLDGIGIQSHFTAIMPAPTQITAVLDQFAQFGLPIESTEFSINTTDRSLQADFLRDYMIAAFAHPKVEGIMHWGFWEGRHWRPNAALWTRDWQLRPHGQVWVDLLEREWNTNVQTATDPLGCARVRGFLGDYRVTVCAGPRSRTMAARLSREGSTLRVVLD